MQQKLMKMHQLLVATIMIFAFCITTS